MSEIHGSGESYESYESRLDLIVSLIRKKAEDIGAGLAMSEQLHGAHSIRLRRLAAVLVEAEARLLERELHDLNEQEVHAVAAVLAEQAQDPAVAGEEERLRAAARWWHERVGGPDPKEREVRALLASLDEPTLPSDAEWLAAAQEWGLDGERPSH